jgi:nicotinamide-nucleotide amidase
MKAEIITIGDELLLGQVIDTNSAWLGQQLNQIGAKVHFKSAVMDSKDAILEALTSATNRSDIVVITGGLGPTKDDITKHTICDFFNTELILNNSVLEFVQQIFSKRNLPMLESNNQQALLPKNCEVLWNKNGTAPGMWFNENKTIYISLPGVPFEMKSIFAEEAIPKLKSIFNFPSILHRTILTCSIGESFLANKIAKIEDALPPYIKLAYLPSVGAVRLRFSAYGNDLDKLTQELNTIIDELYSLIGDYIYGENLDTLPQVIGNLLVQKNATLATAESCSGGFLAHQITSVSGSSNYYLGSIIAYHNLVKENLLNIPNSILVEHGAVSEACVKSMAENVKSILNTKYSIATSGIAGPNGGTIDKPVGTVWIAVSGPRQTIAKVFNFGDNRERTIERTALMGLDMLRKIILND